MFKIAEKVLHLFVVETDTMAGDWGCTSCYVLGHGSGNLGVKCCGPRWWGRIIWSTCVHRPCCAGPC